MPSYEELSSEDQQKVDEALQHIRPACGTFAQSSAKAAWITQSAQVSGALDIIATIDGAIPNATGLSQAGDLTAAEVAELVADLQSIADTYGTDPKRALHLKACGVNAIIRGN